MESRNLTVMFTDMQGFTSRTSAQSRHQNIQMIDRHKQLLLPIIELHKGQLIKTIGDALLCVFESPTNAVLAGMHLQRSLKRHNSRVAEMERMQVRVAINSGEVSVHEHDVYGEAVNIAARIEGTAEAGDVYFSEATYLAMNKAEIPTLLLGEFTLAGIPEKVRLYRVLREGETAPTSAAAQAASAQEMDQPTLRLRPEPDSATFSRAGVLRRSIALMLDLSLAGLLVLFALPSSLQIHTSPELRQLALELLRGSQAVQSEIAQSATSSLRLPDRTATPTNVKERPPFKVRIEKRIQELKGVLLQKGAPLQAAFLKFALSVLVMFLVCHLVLAACLSSTIGSLLCGLRLRTPTGGKIGLLRAGLRTVAMPLSLALGGLGFLYALVNQKRQTLHDKLAGVVVLRA